jgi:hypothetical protein
VADAAGFNANAHLAGTRVLEESSHFRELSWARDLYGSVSRAHFSLLRFRMLRRNEPATVGHEFVFAVRLAQAWKRSPSIGRPLRDSRLGRLVLKDVPVLGELAVLDANESAAIQGAGRPWLEKRPWAIT